jgi:xanthine dehydrogenase YagT iron-sulfur-binding subunit
MTEVEVGITVNGVSRMERIDPRMSLLDLLRERLGLTGSKKGCDHRCGAYVNIVRAITAVAGP